MTTTTRLTADDVSAATKLISWANVAQRAAFTAAMLDRMADVSTSAPATNIATAAERLSGCSTAAIDRLARNLRHDSAILDRRTRTQIVATMADATILAGELGRLHEAWNLVGSGASTEDVELVRSTRETLARSADLIGQMLDAQDVERAARLEAEGSPLPRCYRCESRIEIGSATGLCVGCASDVAVGR